MSTESENRMIDMRVLLRNAKFSGPVSSLYGRWELWWIGNVMVEIYPGGRKWIGYKRGILDENGYSQYRIGDCIDTLYKWISRTLPRKPAAPDGYGA